MYTLLNILEYHLLNLIEYPYRILTGFHIIHKFENTKGACLSAYINPSSINLHMTAY